MSKSFYTTGTGSQQTLTNVQDEKIPIYDSLSDAEADLANLGENQIVATKDEGVGELLHTVDTVEAGTLNPVTSSAVAESLSYSTTEHKTGGVWIDGKPIYRKVIEFGSIPDIEKTVAHNISNLDNVISVGGWARDGTIRISLPYTSKTSGSTSIVVNDTSIILDSPFDFHTYTAYIIIEYTKTTD